MPKPPTNATGRSGPGREPTAAVAASDHLDTRTAAHEAVESLAVGEEGPGTAFVALVVASFHHRAALGEAVETVRAGCGACHAIGMTATAVAIGNPAAEDAGAWIGPEGPPSPGFAVLRLPVAGDSVARLRIDIPDGPPQHWSDATVATHFPGLAASRPAILFADPFTLAAGPLAERLERARATNAGTVFGALASGASMAGANTLVLDSASNGTGAVGLTLGGNLSLDAFAAVGAVGIGPELVVTRGQGERIEELSGRPAAEAMLEAIGFVPEGERPPPPPLTMLGIAVDAAKPRRGRGDWRLRTVTSLGRDGSITVDEAVRPGRTVRFHRIDAEVDANDLALLLDREQLKPPPVAALAWCGTGRSPAEVASLVMRRLAVPTLAATSIGEMLPIEGRTSLQRRSIAVGLVRHRVH
jgi:small ligand-binding sensory domain FIST